MIDRSGARLQALLAFGVLLAAFFLAGPLAHIGLHVPLGYNEGWNAYLAQRAMFPATGPLYPPADTLVFDNYPPLSFYVVGAVGRWLTGDMVVAGRVVALASLLASAGLVGLCVRRLGGTFAGGVAAAVLVLLMAAIVFPAYVAVDEPQWLGHALALAGLAVLLGGRSATRLAAAALLMTAAGMVKHLLVGLPLAVTLWLAWEDRRAAAIWLGSAVAAVGASLLLTEFLWGHDAFADILGHRRIYAPARVLAAAWRLYPLLPMLLIAARAPRSLLATLFVAISLVTGLAERAGDGVNYNAHFETLLACALATGLAVSRSQRPALLAGLAACPLLVLAPLQAGHAWTCLTETAAPWRPLIARIGATPGLVGCESLSLCYWAGKPYAVDVFNLEQDILTGAPLARFDRLAHAHAFAAFEFGGTVARAHRPPRWDFLHEDLELNGYAPGLHGPDGAELLTPTGD